MGREVIEDVEDRDGNLVVRRKIYRTDDPKFPTGYRYALHYGYTDGRGTFSDTTTRTRRRVVTSDTRPTASRRPSSRGC
jgi:hypothetical protein